MNGDWRSAVRGARAILFDFDGTLAPNLDLPDLRRRVLAMTAAQGVPAHVVADCYIVEAVDAATAWLQRHDRGRAEAFHHEAHRFIADFEVAAARETQPFPEIPPALSALRDARKRLGVITRNCRAAVQAAFPHLNDYCHSVLTRDDVAHLKPDPRHLQQALSALGCGAGDAIMVGDGQLDMRLGRAAGVYCIGVLTGSSDAERLAAAGADAVLCRAATLAEAAGEAGATVKL